MNCRGIASDDFFDALIDFFYMYRPCMMVLVKTRTPSCRALWIWQSTSYDCLVVLKVTSCRDLDVWNSSRTQVLFATINDQAMTLLDLKDDKVN